MLRRRHLAHAGVWIVLLLVVAIVAVSLNDGRSSAAGRHIALEPSSFSPGTEVATPPSSVLATSTTAVAPTTAPPTKVTPTTVTPTTQRPVVTAPPVKLQPAVVNPPHPATPAAVTTTGGASNDFSLVGYRWDPCRAITVNSTGPDVSGIVSELAAITGLKLQMVSGFADINVQWGAVPPGGEIGLTAWRAVGSWLTAAGVVISQQAQPYLATVLRHELGHALGLGHASRSNEVMYGSVGNGSPTDYQAGDRAGLHTVGASSGC